MTFKKNLSSRSTTKKQAKFSGKSMSSQPTTLISAMRLKKTKTPVRATSIVTKPNPNDILFGRGGESNNAHGNRRYQKVIESWCHSYSALTSRKAKTQLAWQIYNELKKDGVRFLRREKGSRAWSEAPEEDCRKKISQRLRERALEAKDKKDMASGNDYLTSSSRQKEEAPEMPAVDILPDLEEISSEDPLSQDLSESDDSLETLMDFADEFPSSWTLPEPLPMEAPSMLRTHQPDPMGSYNGVAPFTMDPYYFQAQHNLSHFLGL